jgi:protein O-GlcNAc transferase
VDVRQSLSDALRRHRAGDLSAAEGLYRAVLRDHPAQPDALHLLGVLTHQRGDPAGAEALIRQAIASNPNAPIFHNNLGKALEDLGRLQGAIESYDRAIALAPNYAEAHYNRGVALQAAGDHVAAEAAYRRTREIAPTHFKAAVNLGAALMGQGRPHDAVGVLEQAFALNPDDPSSLRGLMVATLYDPGADEAVRAAAHQRFEERFGGIPSDGLRPYANPRDPRKRLRIGWVSSDFRDHPVARNLEPIFTHRDRSHFEAICYADVAKPDAATAAFKAMADQWRPIHGIGDAAAADLIRSDGVDILVILASRFDQNRPLIAPYRPAPILVSFHDPATSGLHAIDYLIADPVLAPRRTPEQFSERVLRLPSFYVHAPLENAPAIAQPPMMATGHPTFGSFNNPIKVSDPVVALWASVMGAVPDSRLILKYRNRFPPLRPRLARILAAAGVSADRLELGERLLDHASHLSQYNDIDIALDPFPFTGSTTTFESLWMGVPVVTLAGTNMAARWSASILHALKLDEFIAHTPADYVAIAARFARNPQRLAEVRDTLRQRIARSPLCDGLRRTRQVERLFRAIWARWCRQH